MPPRDPPCYLGDSVYVALDVAGRLTLTTNNGAGPTNTIILEPAVWAVLTAFVRTRSAPATDEPVSGPRPR